MRLLVLVFFLCSSCLIQAQNTYFNNAYSSEGHSEIYGTVFVNDSSYVLGGAFVSDSTSFLMREHSLEGEILASEEFAAINPGLYWVPPRNMTRTEDAQHYFMFSAADIGEGKQGFLMKLNAAFDTLWTKYYTLDPDGSSFFDAGLVHDNHLILVAECNNFTGGDYNNRLRIVKLDLDGNLVWNKVVDDATQLVLNLPRFLAQSQSGYLIGGANLFFIGSEVEVTPIVRKVDFDGEIEWTFDQEFDSNNFGEGTSHVLMHSNGRVYSATTVSHTEIVPGSGIYHVDPRIRGLDYSNGDVLNDWQIVAGQELGFIDALGFVESSDEQLVVLLGSSLSQDTKPYLMKIDTLGNILWEHEYSYMPEENWYRQTLVDIKNTPDGGYIMAGELVHNDAISERWSWVLKVDGCGDVEWQDCDLVGVEDLDPSTGSSSILEVYPNPVQETLNIAVTLPGQNLSYSILNPLAQVMATGPLNAGASSIDFAHFAPGSYWLRVYDANGSLRLSETLIKE
jgi:hypothetical protein